MRDTLLRVFGLRAIVQVVCAEVIEHLLDNANLVSDLGRLLRLGVGRPAGG
jgi:hypothetical protein